MSDQERQRLAAILGMLGSAHAGERAAAGLQAEAFRKRHGLTWADLLASQAEEHPPDLPPPPPPEPPPAPRWARTTDWRDLQKVVFYILVSAGVFLGNHLMH